MVMHALYLAGINGVSQVLVAHTHQQGVHSCGHILPFGSLCVYLPMFIKKKLYNNKSVTFENRTCELPCVCSTFCDSGKQTSYFAMTLIIGLISYIYIYIYIYVYSKHPVCCIVLHVCEQHFTSVLHSLWDWTVLKVC
jgi:hypothetical protein